MGGQEADGQDVHEASGRRETEAERLDRKYGDLLQELRVTQTGTQILFAFLLTVAFTPVLQDADAFSHRLLAVDLVLAGLATALIIAPVALHRVVEGEGLKEPLVQVASRLTQAGLLLLMAAMVGTVLLALDAVLQRTTAYLVAGGVLAWYVLAWYALPAVVRARGSRSTVGR